MDFDDSYSAITDANLDLDDYNEDPDIEISNFSQEEMKKIANVLEDDKTVRNTERARRRKFVEGIDEKIVEIKMKNIDDGVKFCSNCGEKFRMLINPRRVCSECNNGICDGCTEVLKDEKRMCRLCSYEASRELKTGKWFAMTSKNNGRFRKPPTTVVMNSMRKLKTKPPAPLISNGSIRSSDSSKSAGSKHIPIYIPKIEIPTDDSFRNNSTKYLPRIVSPVSVKREIDKKVDTIANESAVDVVDFGINEHEVQKLNNISRHHHGLNLLGSNLQSTKHMSTSANSIYSETFESYKSGLVVSGDILFSVHYDDSNKTLNIFVDQCQNLAVADRNKRQTNPYIKTYLLPDKTKASKKKSSSKKSSLSPIFKETLTYYVSKESLSSRTLSVAVWHQRFLTYNYFLGEVHILLADMDLSGNESIWYPLQEKMKYPNRSGGHIYKGELIIKLKYRPSSRKDGKGSLDVFIVEAQQLEAEGEPLNAYVKGYLLPDRSNKSKKKTSVQKGNKHIIWNSLMQFSDVTLEELKDRSLELSVYHYRRLKSNEFLGGVRLNHGLGLHCSDHVSWMDAQGTEKTTWEKFLSNPNETTEAILNLRPNLEY